MLKLSWKLEECKPLVMGDTLFSGSYDSTLRAYDINTLKPLKVLEGHTGPVRTLAVLNGCLFSGSYDKTVRVWDTITLEPITAGPCRLTPGRPQVDPSLTPD
jgi:WD40 repeat protein